VGIGDWGDDVAIHYLIVGGAGFIGTEGAMREWI
jgi:hypothetical protein